MCSTYQKALYNVNGVDQNSVSHKQALVFFESHLHIAEEILIIKTPEKCMKK
jgi:hypothetical protein